MEDRQQLFGAVLGSIQDELDWERLGRAYCEGDGSSFFDDESRERWLDAGLLIADELAQHLPRGRGRSAYIGAALAEIPVLLVESLVLGREVVWVNLPGDEIQELERVLRLVGERRGLELPLPSNAPIESLPQHVFDHVWLVSVLTDPEHFPALHDELYERHGTVLATNRGALAAERARAEQLAGAVLALAADGALLTTSEEELAVLLPLARARDRVLRPLDRHRRGPRPVSGIVGDVVRFLRLWSRDAPPEA
ncbi:MAG: hypothetical protein JNK02_10865 [Planctomycetes bacterium]|nr:hypothetical protein [Planctomycetota bacterium]